MTFGNPHPEPPKLVSCAWVHLDAGIGICAHYLIHKFKEALGSATELHDVQLELPIIVRKLNGAIIAVGFGLLGSAYGDRIVHRAPIVRKEVRATLATPRKAVDN